MGKKLTIISTKGEWLLVCKDTVLSQIEDLRWELNTMYKLHSAFTPELIELSTRLDQLLNKLYVKTN
ncbi:Spo0E family sporulation regulatory protein-aspartic acid phosphatase [Brevibacillus sp. SYSU BS000544]|uniref:Spo0E family sporulation regulatory protein-aspartic acid phosphatase n=1 Tax=Brevibacillus sp. SYSU BS000544 TaxID=3416443 RepID=UPI003CE5B1FB